MKFDFKNGIYDGAVNQNNLPEGRGVFTKPNELVYEGGFVNGEFNGYGVLAISRGAAYEGNFVNGDFNGLGKLSLETGVNYEGSFLNGLYDGMGRLTLGDGTAYEGAFVQGSFDGMGRLSLPDGTTYEGGFSCGVYHGIGRLILPSGERFEGTFKNGEFVEGDHCREPFDKRSSRADNDIRAFGCPSIDSSDSLSEHERASFTYEGDSDEGGIPNGVGRITFDDGSYYEGEFRNGYANGTGRSVSSAGTYVGEFVDGDFNGYGELFLASGEVKRGIWENGNLIEEIDEEAEVNPSNSTDFSRDAEIIASNLNKILNGETVCGCCNTTDSTDPQEPPVADEDDEVDACELDGDDSKRDIDDENDGYDDLDYEDSDYEDSDYEESDYEESDYEESDYEESDHEPNDKVKYVWDDGSYYEGDSVNGKPNGSGKYVWSDGSSYEGDFVDGCFNGYGRYISSDGDVYEGAWKDDVPFGIGRYTLHDGTVILGNFIEDDKAIGRVKYPSGDTYKGEICGLELHGMGIMTYASGSVYSGNWKNGSRHGKGIMIYANGKAYRGEWRGDAWHGKGVLWVNGSIFSAFWQSCNNSSNVTFFENMERVRYGQLVDGEFIEGDEPINRAPLPRKRTIPTLDDLDCLDGIEIPDEDAPICSSNDDYPSCDSLTGDDSFESDDCPTYSPSEDESVCDSENDGGALDSDSTYVMFDTTMSGSYEGERNKRNFPHGQGVMRYTNGDIYEGRWALGDWNGEGTLTLHTGAIIKGVFQSTGNAREATLTANDTTVKGFFENGDFFPYQ